MSLIFKSDALVKAQVVELVAHERAKSLSSREWKHRLAGFGYSIRDTELGQVIETLPHRVVVCDLPAELCA